MLSLRTLCGFAAIFLLLYIIFKPIITYIRDPLDLRKYPSPNLLAAITPLWIVHQTLTGLRSRTIHEQHDRFGDVIRVGPKHLMFNDPRAVKDIYGMTAISRIGKDDFYDRLAGEHHDLVLVRDRPEHARRRKALTNAFALKTVVNMEPVIRDKAQQLLEQIDTRCADGEGDVDKEGFGSINIRRWYISPPCFQRIRQVTNLVCRFNLFTMDVIGDMAFGLPMGFLQSGNDSKEAETRSGTIYRVSSTIRSLHRGVLFNVSLAEMGSHRLGQLVKSIVHALPLLAERLGAKAGTDFEDICIRQLRKRMDKGPPSRPSGDFMAFILDQNLSKTHLPDDEGRQIPPFGELVADSNMMMNAGSDTTAAALSNTLYHLLANPHCLQKLRHEIDEHIPFASDEDAGDGVSAYASVSELPYLRACIDETLRLRPPIAFQLPRLVHAPEGATISDHHIQQGTVVAVSPYTIHRNKDLYPDPDTFNPDRWIDKSDPEQLRRLRAYTIPFSQGSRACIGRHIAIVELQIMISTLVRRYDMSLSRPGQVLEIFDRFNANPGPLPIRVKRRSKVVECA